MEGPVDVITRWAWRVALSLRQLGFFFSQDAIMLYGFVICSSVIVSHTLTYLILATGHGCEMNPLASATIGLPPMLNVGLWAGAMAGLTMFLREKFEGNREVVLALILPLLTMTILDAANDIAIALQLGIIR